MGILVSPRISGSQVFSFTRRRHTSDAGSPESECGPWRGVRKVSVRHQAVLKRFLMEGARMIHGPSGTSGRFDTLLPVRPHRVSDRSSATALLRCWYRFSPLQAWGPGRCLDRSFQKPRSASRDPLIWQSPRRFVRAYRQILDYGVCTDRADEYLSHYSEINNRNSTLRYRTKHNDNESIQY
jgi:hypothetical protein